MSSLSSLSSSSSHAAPSLAFVSLPPRTAAAALAWKSAQALKRQAHSSSSTPLKSSLADGNNESEAEDASEASSSSILSKCNNDDASNVATPASTSKPNMGASIGAHNVGEMLFNEQLLKSGRGDVRVGPMSRWKDFRGNEIVPDNIVDGPN